MRKQQPTPNLPSFEQVVNLALAQVGGTLDSMEDMARIDDKWGDTEVECSVDAAIDMVREAVESMRARPPKTVEEFSRRWHLVIGVVDLAKRSFQRDSCYRNLLAALDRQVLVFDGAVECAVLAGES